MSERIMAAGGNQIVDLPGKMASFSGTPSLKDGLKRDQWPVRLADTYALIDLLKGNPD